MVSVRRWTRAWIAGLVLVLLPAACKQEPTDPFGSSRTKDPVGHPVLGVESVPVNGRSEEHTSELQSQSNLVCRLLLEKKKLNITLETAPGTLAVFFVLPRWPFRTR